MEADTALIRADGVVELYAVAKVGLHFAAVVDPCDTEREDAVGLDHTLYNAGLFKLRVLVVDIFHTHQHFFHSLQILLFTRVLGLEGAHDTVNVHFLIL